MKIIKNYGLVIYENNNNGGSNKFIYILLKDYGKIKVFVRGGKKLNNKLFACSQIFCCCEFIIEQDKKNKELFILLEASLLENFSPKGYINFCYASYFCELVNKFLLDGYLANNNLLLLIKTLKANKLIEKDINYNYYLARIFEFKFMKLNGFEPEINFCHACNKLINKNELFFDGYGLVCKNCLDKKKNFCRLSEYSLLILKNILRLRFNNLLELDKLDLNLKNNFWLKELISAARIFMSFNLDLKLNSKKFICEIENF